MIKYLSLIGISLKNINYKFVYVNGVLNRYGDPYVVIDSAVLEGKEAQQSMLFIVLNDESHTCLRITDVRDFFTASEKDVIHFSEEELSDYYEGTLKVKNQEVFVLKVQAIIEKVKKEIAAAWKIHLHHISSNRFSHP